MYKHTQVQQLSEHITCLAHMSLKIDANSKINENQNKLHSDSTFLIKVR